VQTIEFTPADTMADLPRPRTVAELEAMMLNEKRMTAMISEQTAPDVEAHKAAQAAADAEAAALAAAKATEDEKDVEMDVDSDEDEGEDVMATIAKAKEEAQLAHARELQARSTEHGAPMKIRNDYVPKRKLPCCFSCLLVLNHPFLALATRQVKVAITTCQICGQQIPESEFDEHRRIELLDPQWKNQRNVLEARRAQGHELQRGANVSSALKQLARTRGDLFEADEEKHKQEDEEEAARRKERERAVWDGHTASKEGTLNKFQSNVNFEEQIAAIHKAHGLGQTDTSTIGPNIGPSIPNSGSSLPPPPISLPQNPTLLAGDNSGVISAGPQPPSAMHHPLPLPPSFAGVTASADFVPASAIPAIGMHPSRLAALGTPMGLPTRPADDAFGMDGMDQPMAKRPRIERPEGHYYPVSRTAPLVALRVF